MDGILCSGLTKRMTYWTVEESTTLGRVIRGLARGHIVFMTMPAFPLPRPFLPFLEASGAPLPPPPPLRILKIVAAAAAPNAPSSE